MTPGWLAVCTEGGCRNFPLEMASPSTGAAKAVLDYVCLGGDGRCLKAVVNSLNALQLLPAFTWVLLVGFGA